MAKRPSARVLGATWLTLLLGPGNFAGAEVAGAEGAGAEATASRLAECQRLFVAEPQGWGYYRCFLAAVHDPRLRTEALAHLDEYLAENPDDNPWLLFTAGNAALEARPVRAESLLARAAERFRRDGQSGIAALALVGRAAALRNQGRLAETGPVYERAAELAAGEPERLAQVQLEWSIYLREMGEELDRAYRLLREAEAALFPGNRLGPQRSCLIALANLSYELGRHGESLAYNRRVLEMAERAGDRSSTATIRFNLALAHLSLWPQQGSREEVRRLMREALEAAETADRGSTRVAALHELGKLDPGPQGRDHLERCLALAPEHSPDKLPACQIALAFRLADEDPVRSEALTEAFLTDLAESDDPWTRIHSWPELLGLRWATRPRPEALAEAFTTLDSIEALRDLQAAESGRAGLFSVWTEAYQWLSGRVLEDAGNNPPREDLELAFAVTERMRARLLLEALDAASPPERNPSDPVEAAGRALLAEQVRLRRQLLDPALPGARRAELLAELDAAEREEADLLHRSAGNRDQAGAVPPPELADPSAVEAALGADEALFSFQLAPWEDVYGRFAGGSWLLAVTRGGTRAYRLPGPAVLGPAAEVFLGLFERRDGSEAPAARRLYQDLLGEALAELPAEVRHLVLVPDGVLHRLPFAVLADEDGRPLVQRFRLSVTPSATLWKRWRESPPQGEPAAVLAFADPALPFGGGGGAGSPAVSRSGALSRGTVLGALPHARREGRRAADRLGGASRVLAGEEASEAALKAASLAPYGVLHFAAHALLDEREPRRSAVVLAPGSPGEDGLLQPREIQGLALDGKLVVLSACRSASGEVLRGEGVMGLARAFFQAGSPAVVGSLWRLRDDDAAALFDAFYRHLALGESAAAALARAQAERLAAGAPAAAWAGVAVLGDGALVPVPGGRASRLPSWVSLPAWPWLLGLAMAAAAAIIALLAIRYSANSGA